MVQVKSSGYSAEYGGSTGGVLNVVTKSGSNDGRGQALLLFSGDALDAGLRPTLRLVPSDTTRAEYVTYPEDDYRQVEPGFTLGGPVVRNRAWFFAGYVPSLRDTNRTLTFLGETRPSTFSQRATRHHVAANVSAQLGPRWRTKAAFSSGRDVQRGLLPVEDGTGNPAASYSIDEIIPNYSASASVDYMPSGRAYLSARTVNLATPSKRAFIRATCSLTAPPRLTSPAFPPTSSIRATSRTCRRISAAIVRAGRISALQVDGTVTFTAAGRHQVKGGVQFDRVGIDALSGLTGNVINLFWGQAFDGVAGARTGYYSVVSNDLLPNRGFITAGKATVNNVGLFLQDEWTLGSRLTLQVGLRTENEHVPSLARDPGIPPTAIHFGFADKLAPRLGLAWDATGDHKTKVYGSWGVFHDITKLQITQSFGGLRGSNFFWFTLDSPDFRPIVDNPACPPACPGSLILGEFSPIVPINHPDAHAIDPALAQMRLQELVIGVERELALRSRQARGTSTSRSIGRSKTSLRSCREKRSRCFSSVTPASAPRRSSIRAEGPPRWRCPRPCATTTRSRSRWIAVSPAAGPRAPRTRGAGCRATTRVSPCPMRTGVSRRTSVGCSTSRWACSTSGANRCTACSPRTVPTR